MTQAKVYKRRKMAKGAGVWGRVLKGLIISIAVTGVCVLVFALLMQWLRPADGTIRVSLGMFNTMEEIEETAKQMERMFTLLSKYKRR